MPKLSRQRAITLGVEHGEQQFPPRTKPARYSHRYTIPANTFCLVSRVSPLHWREHHTQADLWFDRYETWKDGILTFRLDFWLIQVRSSLVSMPARRPS